MAQAEDLLVSQPPRSPIATLSAENCLEAGRKEIGENSYLLTGQFVGDDPDDIIPFSRIDHGAYPSPDLGGEFLHDTDDWRRLRARCVDRLRFEAKHTFLSCGQLLQDVNRRLSFLPEWKRVEFTDRYLEVDRENLEHAVTFRKEGERTYAYLHSVYDAEREIEDRIRKLVGYSDIAFKSPVTERHWRDLLFEPKSPLRPTANSWFTKLASDVSKNHLPRSQESLISLGAQRKLAA